MHITFAFHLLVTHKKKVWHSFVLCASVGWATEMERDRQIKLNEKVKLDILPGVHSGAQFLCLLPCLLPLLSILYTLRRNRAIRHYIHNVLLQGKMLLEVDRNILNTLEKI